MSFLQGTQAGQRPNVPKKKFQGKSKSSAKTSVSQGKTAQGSPAIDNRKNPAILVESRARSAGMATTSTNPFSVTGARGAHNAQIDPNPGDNPSGLDDHDVVSTRKPTSKKKFIGKLKGFSGGAIGRGFGK